MTEKQMIKANSLYYLSGAMETEIYFKPTGVVKKIMDFLKKEI